MKPLIIPYRNFKMTIDDKVLKPFKQGPLDTNQLIEFAMINKGICCIAFLKEGVAIVDLTKFKAINRLKLFPYDDVVELFRSGVTLHLLCNKYMHWKTGVLANELDLPLVDEANKLIKWRKECLPAPEKVIARPCVKVDVPSGKIVFYQDDQTIEFPDKKILSWNDVAAVEVITNDGEIRKTGLGRAVAGGILLGEVGLIAGAASGKKTSKKIIYSTDIFVKTNDLSNPIVKIPLFSGKLKSDSKQYSELVELTQRLVSMFEIVIRK